jgi:predicted nucleic acid-binding protein
MAETPYLVDSNILLRWVKPDHNDYPIIVSAIDSILQSGGVLCYTSQNLGDDARLAAAMRVHDVKRILTFNDRDFARYTHIEAVHPRTVQTD